MHLVNERVYFLSYLMCILQIISTCLNDLNQNFVALYTLMYDCGRVDGCLKFQWNLWPIYMITHLNSLPNWNIGTGGKVILELSMGSETYFRCFRKKSFILPIHHPTTLYGQQWLRWYVLWFSITSLKLDSTRYFVGEKSKPQSGKIQEYLPHISCSKNS